MYYKHLFKYYLITYLFYNNKNLFNKIENLIISLKKMFKTIFKTFVSNKKVAPMLLGTLGLGLA